MATWAADGRQLTHELAAGDAILFHSEKRHNVTQVLSGSRSSLVIELWSASPNLVDRYG